MPAFPPFMLMAIVLLGLAAFGGWLASRVNTKQPPRRAKPGRTVVVEERTDQTQHAFGLTSEQLVIMGALVFFFIFMLGFVVSLVHV